jgi:hypothetical protein
VVLLTMLIIAAIATTLYESSFEAKVAGGYVYGAPWFNLCRRRHKGHWTGLLVHLSSLGWEHSRNSERSWELSAC